MGQGMCGGDAGDRCTIFLVQNESNVTMTAQLRAPQARGKMMDESPSSLSCFITVHTQTRTHTPTSTQSQGNTNTEFAHTMTMHTLQLQRHLEMHTQMHIHATYMLTQGRLVMHTYTNIGWFTHTLSDHMGYNKVVSHTHTHTHKHTALASLW